MKSTIKIVTCMMLLMFSYQSYSTTGLLRSFESRYSNTADRDCLFCHQFSYGGTNWNSYGAALLFSNTDFSSIEGLDSDGDGLSNLYEIENGLDPGLVKTFENTFTYSATASIEGQAPTVFDTDGGFDTGEEVCFPVKTDFDTEASFYCLLP